jgi:geranylgeranyl diphosphate synthase type I
MNAPPALETYRVDIDAKLHAQFADRNVPLYDMMRYHLGWTDVDGRVESGSANGKALRPALCCMACRAVGGSIHEALPAAAALELIHNFSLIHDDVQDGDLLRRNRKTVWSVWGKPQAINVGTAMRIMANNALRELVNTTTLALRMQVQDILDDATLRLIEGQYLDISFEERDDVTAVEYLKMVSGKTAALMAASLEAGALIGSQDPAVSAGFSSFGISLGKAFQIRDDILGIWGTESEFGKPIGSDIRKRKKTYPIISALERIPGERTEVVLEILRREPVDENGVQEVMDALESAGSKALSQELVDTFTAQAQLELERLSLPEEDHAAFLELLYFLAERER